MRSFLQRSHLLFINGLGIFELYTFGIFKANYYKLELYEVTTKGKPKKTKFSGRQKLKVFERIKVFGAKPEGF